MTPEDYLLSKGFQRNKDIFTRTRQVPGNMVINGQPMMQQETITFTYLGEGEVDGQPIKGFKLQKEGLEIDLWEEADGDTFFIGVI